MTLPTHDRMPLNSNPWKFNEATNIPPDVGEQKYSLIPATQEDIRKVAEIYSRVPIDGYEVSSVDVIYNSQEQKRFELYVQKLNLRPNDPEFQQNSKTNVLVNNLEWRKQIFQSFEERTSSYRVIDFPNVKFLPVWYGVEKSAISGICESGFKTTKGYFGDGIYFFINPEYAHKMYSQGLLFFSWVAIFLPFPVVFRDDPNQLDQYDACIIPVVPRDPNHLNGGFDPCVANTDYWDTQVLMKESTACLPRFLVRLTRAISRPIPMRPYTSSTQGGTYVPMGSRRENRSISSSTASERTKKQKKRPRSSSASSPPKSLRKAFSFLTKSDMKKS